VLAKAPRGIGTAAHADGASAAWRCCGVARAGRGRDAGCADGERGAAFHETYLHAQSHAGLLRAHGYLVEGDEYSRREFPTSDAGQL